MPVIHITLMDAKNRNPIHQLPGYVLEQLLTPLNVMVKTSLRLMAESPLADIMLLRRDDIRWTEAQRALLPDGIRDTKADHVLIEFKNTESLNRRVLYQALSYRYIFLETQRLKPERLHTVIISAKTPVKDFRRQFEFSAPVHSGVLESRNICLDVLQMLVLNELSDAPHNQYIKCFASRRAVRLKAAQQVLASGVKNISQIMIWFFVGLLNLYGGKQKGDAMQEYSHVSPEVVSLLGKNLINEIMARLRPEDRLAGLRPEDRLAGLRPEDRLAGLRPEDLLDSLSPEDIMAYMKKKRMVEQ